MFLLKLQTYLHFQVQCWSSLYNFVSKRVTNFSLRLHVQNSINTDPRSYTRADEPTARGIHCCPQYYFFWSITVFILWSIHVCVHIHISDCVETVYELPLLPKNTAIETFLHISGAVRSVDWICHWDANLAMTRRIRDIRQNVLKYSFQTGRSSSSSSSSSLLLSCFLPYCIPRGGLYYKNNNYTIHYL